MQRKIKLLFLILLAFLLLPTMAFSKPALLGVYIDKDLEYSSKPIYLKAYAIYDDGTNREVTNSGTWDIKTGSSVAEIDNRGKLEFTGMPGNVEVSFSYGGKEDFVTTNVKQFLSLEISPDKLKYSKSGKKLKAIGRFDDGDGKIEKKTLKDTEVSWVVSNDRVVKVDSSGKASFTGKKGRAVIRAIPKGPFIMDYEDLPEIVVVVTDEDVDEDEEEDDRPFKLVIEGEINPDKKRTKLKAYKEFSYHDDDRETIKNKDITWFSYNTDIAEVDDNGVVTLTGQPGKTYITGKYKRWSSNKLEVVVPVKYEELIINETLNFTPVFFRVPPKLTVTSKDTAGDSKLLSQVEWSSSNEEVAWIDSSGRITFTGKTGAVTFTAKHENLTASISCTVPEEEEKTIEKVIIPENLFYGPNPQVLKAYAIYSDGTRKNITSEGNWSSNNENVAMVERGNVFFTGKSGAVTITFNYNNFTDNVKTIIKSTNSKNKLTAIKFSKNHFTNMDNNQKITVYGIYSDNSKKPLPNVKIYSYQPNIATVKNNILKLSGFPGKAQLVAEASGFRTTSEIDILESNIGNFLAYIKIEGSLDTPGNYKQLKTWAIYGDGQQIDVTDETVWNSNDIKIAQIKDKGFIEILRQGPVKISASYQGLTTQLSNKPYYFLRQIHPLKTSLIPLANIKTQIQNRLNKHLFIPYPTDINGHWAQNDIRLAQRLGWIGGYPDGSIKPNNTMSRGEFASLLERTLNLKTSYRSVLYSDINNHWAKESILTIANLGLVPLDGSHTFRPNDSITRQEMAQIIDNLIQVRADTDYPFLDVPSDHPAAFAIAKVNRAGIMSGTDFIHFQPEKPATRAESLAVLMRLLKTDPELASILNSAPAN